MTGRIFDIQRFSVHDGPGIRTTVFLSGCNLRCFWCHNPESHETERRLQYVEAKCVGCGKCAAACPNGCHRFDGNERAIDRPSCVSCGVCASVCWSGALTMTSRTEESGRVLGIVALDKPFYKNKGGMTVSGGEPLLQPEFTEELLRGAKEKGIHTAVDTAGNAPFPVFERLLPFTDLFLYDIKVMDETAHIRSTGSGNRVILENLMSLSEAGAEILVRIPVIPGVNDSMENMEETAEFLTCLKRGVRGAELLNFHPLGGGKYGPLGMKYEAEGMKPLSAERMKELTAPFGEAGIRIGGGT